MLSGFPRAAALLAAGLALLSQPAACDHTFDESMDFEVSVWRGTGRLAQMEYQIPNKAALADDPYFSLSIDPVIIEPVACNYQNDLYLRKRPGRAKYGDITLKKGFVEPALLRAGEDTGCCGANPPLACCKRNFFSDWFQESAACLASPDCSAWGAKSAVRDLDVTVWRNDSTRDGPGSRTFSFKNCVAKSYRVSTSCPADGSPCRPVEEIVLRIGHVDIATAAPPVAPAPGRREEGGGGHVSPQDALLVINFVNTNAASGARESFSLGAARYVNPGTVTVPARLAPRCEPGGGLDNDCDGFAVRGEQGCVSGDPDAAFACADTVAEARLADAFGLKVHGENVSNPYVKLHAEDSNDVAVRYNRGGGAGGAVYVTGGAPLSTAPAGVAGAACATATAPADAPAGAASSVGGAACPRACANDVSLCAINTATRCSPRRCFGDGRDNDCDGVVEEAAARFGGVIEVSTDGTVENDDNSARLTLPGVTNADYRLPSVAAAVQTALKKGSGLGTRNVATANTAKPPILLEAPDGGALGGGAAAAANPDLFFPHQTGGGTGSGLATAQAGLAGFVDNTASTSRAPDSDNAPVPKRGYVAQGALLLVPAVPAPGAAPAWETGGVLYALHRKHRRAARHHRRAARAHRRVLPEVGDEVLVVTFDEGDPEQLTCMGTAGELDGLADAEAFAAGAAVGMTASRVGCSGHGCGEAFHNVFLRQYDFPSLAGAGVGGEKVWVEAEKPTCPMWTGGVLTVNVCHL